MKFVRPDHSHPGHLCAAVGYVDLGMLKEARRELARLEPALHDTPTVLIVRLKIYQAARAWQKAAAVAAKLCTLRPWETLWPITHAEAVRYGGSSRRAKLILMESAVRFPREAMIYYSLACIEVESGRLEIARMYLQIAFRLRRRLRLLAAQDQDLLPLYARPTPNAP